MWFLFKGTASIFPENASLFRNAGKVLCVLLVLGTIGSGISRLGEGKRIAAAEQLVQQHDRIQPQIHAFLQDKGVDPETIIRADGVYHKGFLAISSVQDFRGKKYSVDFKLRL